ncbi:hypothetical protein TNCV_3595131 [Trichonephila clavipes]|nr:hypothetical protein TNCV_3595131 [Trichonephila clavipes]
MSETCHYQDTVKTEIVTKDHTSTTLIEPGTVAIGLDGCTGMRGKQRNGQRERKFQTLSLLWRVMLDTCIRDIQWVIDNEESGAMTTAAVAVLKVISVLVDSLLPTSSNHGEII